MVSLEMVIGATRELKESYIAANTQTLFFDFTPQQHTTAPAPPTTA